MYLPLSTKTEDKHKSLQVVSTIQSLLLALTLGMMLPPREKGGVLLRCEGAGNPKWGVRFTADSNHCSSIGTQRQHSYPDRLLRPGNDYELLFSGQIRWASCSSARNAGTPLYPGFCPQLWEHCSIPASCSETWAKILCERNYRKSLVIVKPNYKVMWSLRADLLSS